MYSKCQHRHSSILYDSAIFNTEGCDHCLFSTCVGLSPIQEFHAMSKGVTRCLYPLPTWQTSPSQGIIGDEGHIRSSRRLLCIQQNLVRRLLHLDSACKVHSSDGIDCVVYAKPVSIVITSYEHWHMSCITLQSIRAILDGTLKT